MKHVRTNKSTPKGKGLVKSQSFERQLSTLASGKKAKRGKKKCCLPRRFYGAKMPDARVRFLTGWK
jgi:hypothetical protein